MNRVYLIYFVALIFGLFVAGRILFVQFTEGSELRAKAKEYQVKVFPVKASRGNILSDNGTLMSVSLPRYDIRIDTKASGITKDIFLNEVDSLAWNLSKLFKGKSARKYSRELRRARQKNHRYHLLRRNASFIELKKLKRFPIVRKGKNRGGLIIIQKNSRIRPFHNLALRTIGYERDSLLVGIEGAYSPFLAGVDGSVLRQKIGHGDWRDVPDGAFKEAKEGYDVVTTIDINVQDVAEETLYDQLIKENAYEGCAVLMEVKTGYIKAIANLRWDDDKKKYIESYNMAIGERIEPGSTFKVASILVALEDEKIKLDDLIDIGRGRKKYYKHTMRDAHFDGQSEITVRKAFEKSSNVGVSDFIVEHYDENPTAFVEGLEKLGLNESLQLELDGEPSPKIPHPSDKKHWYGTSLPWMSIGYGLSLTPLQMLSLYNTIANDGKMMQPQFVKEITHNGELIKSFPPKVLRESICSQATIDTVKSLLEGVILRGTGRQMASKFYAIAGKTGTAQIAQGGKYNKVNYNASFAGYFPADNPRYSCIVVIANPSAGRIYGSSVAGPVFKGIADKVYATDIEFNESPPMKADIGIPYKNGANLADLECMFGATGIEIDSTSSDADYVFLQEKNGKAFMQRRVFHETVMPNLIGMGARDAVYLLQKSGLKVKIEGRGDVTYQSIPAGKRLQKGQDIKLKMS